MKRPQLEHILRAATAITGANQFVIVGSQAILGQFPDPPEELTVSNEADIFSLRNEEDAELIDGTIGEASPFHRTFGYYAHGVGENTAKLPLGWKDRLVPVQTPSTGGATGFCLEVHDLAVSKLVAGRSKDLEFVAGLLRHGLAQADLIARRFENTELEPTVLQQCVARLLRLSNSQV